MNRKIHFQPLHSTMTQAHYYQLQAEAESKPTVRRARAERGPTAIIAANRRRTNNK